MPPVERPPVLVLGAGVNGACVARELVLNGVGVWLVDIFDIAFGATAKSTRLIHGGLRYLEYGDLALVRESLDERARLLRLAPQFVRPLRLHIPIRRRVGGFLAAALRVSQLTRFDAGALAARALAGRGGRGLLTVRAGLALYDRLTGRDALPAHSVVRVGEQGPQVNSRYSWLCSYSDAQMPLPERFTLALLHDARSSAAEQGIDFRVMPHYRARLQNDGEVLIEPVAGEDQPGSVGQSAAQTLRPAAIVNATGAWGDRALRDLPATSPRLFGGTKGSHIITRERRLCGALGADGVYAEADDGRLVFILPIDDAVLIGTTDERFDGPPEQAIATEQEIDYLVQMTNEVFPQARLKRSDVAAHYCGVRPLPETTGGAAGAIPRGHRIASIRSHGLTIDTLIGGKLTTCRALGEAAADRILARLHRPRCASTRERPIPGADGLTGSAAARSAFWRTAAGETGFSMETVASCGRLLGSLAVGVLQSLKTADERALVRGTLFPRGFVGHLISTEWVSRLDDLVERRLKLTDGAHIDQETLQELAALVADDAAEARRQLDRCRDRLAVYYGIRLVQDNVQPTAVRGPP